MKKLLIYNLSFLILNSFCFSQNADSTHQKHPLFKISGVALLGGGGYSNLSFLGDNNPAYNSKASLQSIWPAFASKPFYNYSPQWNGYYNHFGSGMFGAYFNMDTYSKKKSRYAKHFQTNVGITVVGLKSEYGEYIGNGKVTYFQPIYTVSGTTLTPAYYKVGETFDYAYIGYLSTNVGLDMQQVFSSNQKRILSFFIGLGASVNFSVVSQISYAQYQHRDTVLSLATPPNYNYQYTNPYYSVSHFAPDSFITNGYAKVKGSVLYQLYIPFGFNVRLGKNDKKFISHIYLTTQIRMGISILKIQTINAFYYKSSYATFGVKYRF